MVETTDLLFAVDSIPAVFAVTRKPFIVFTSNVFAILGLRSLYFLLAGAIGYFRYLKYGLPVVLVFMGVEMLLDPHDDSRRFGFRLISPPPFPCWSSPASSHFHRPIGACRRREKGAQSHAADTQASLISPNEVSAGPCAALPQTALAPELWRAGTCCMSRRCSPNACLNRGLSEPAAISSFLQPRLKQLADPFLLPNMAAAVERLFQARERDEPLVIFGDYDVDGVTSTALLLEVLRPLGWKVHYYLPHRMDEGYGLSQDGVENCLAKFPVTLLLAVDCGSTAVASIAWLRERGASM